MDAGPERAGETVRHTASPKQWDQAQALRCAVVGESVVGWRDGVVDEGVRGDCSSRRSSGRAVTCFPSYLSLLSAGILAGIKFQTCRMCRLQDSAILHHCEAALARDTGGDVLDAERACILI